MIRHSRRTRLLVGAVLATLLTLTVSACSTGTVGGSSTPASTASGSASGDSAEALQAAYDGDLTASAL